MAIRTVTSDATYATALAASVSGDTIKLADAGTFGALTANVAGLTVIAETAGVAKCASISVPNAQNVTLSGFKVQPTAAPNVAVSGNIDKLVSASNNVGGLILDGLNVHGGYAPESFADFDPTADYTRYPEFGPPGGSGTAVGSPTANVIQRDYWYGFGTIGAMTGDLTIQNCTFSDTSSLVKFSHIGNGCAIKINNNRFLRPYQDYVAFGFYGASATAPPRLIEVCGNEFGDSFAQPQDNGNPHGDVCQIYGSDNTPLWLHTIPNLLFAGNISYQRPGTRGQHQRLFESDYAYGYPFIGARFIENLLLSRISPKGLQLSSSGAGGISTYVLRNAFLSIPTNNTPIQNEATGNTFNPTPASGASAAAIDVTRDTSAGFTTRQLIAGNITESIVNNGASDTVGIANVITGLGTSSNTYASVFNTPSGGWAGLDTADKIVNAYKPIAPYTAAGPVASGITTAAAFRSRWAVPANRPWASLPSHAGWVDAQEVGLSTLAVSDWSYVHAGMASRSLSVSGCEYQTCDSNAEFLPNPASAGAWSTASTTILDTGAGGKWLRLRKTSSSSKATAVKANVTIGSETFTWNVNTIATDAFPVVSFDATTTAVVASPTSYGADSAVGTLVVRLRAAAHPASIQSIISVGSGSSKLTLQMLTTGRLRLALTGTPSGTARLDMVPDVADGTFYTCMFSWDFSDPTEATGRSVYVNGQPVSVATSSWGGGAGLKVNTGYSAGTPNICGSFIGDIAMLWMDTSQRLDLDSIDVRNTFDAGAIGVTGQGPLGRAPQVCMIGTAAQWNSGSGLNLGSGAKYFMTGNVSAANALAWPPTAASSDARRGFLRRFKIKG